MNGNNQPLQPEYTKRLFSHIVVSSKCLVRYLHEFMVITMVKQTNDLRLWGHEAAVIHERCPMNCALRSSGHSDAANAAAFKGYQKLKTCGLPHELHGFFLFEVVLIGR